MRKVIIIIGLMGALELEAQVYGQGNWNGGPSVCGPVSSWGTQFCSEDSVAWGMPGQINPIATSYDWSNWVLDTIELTGPGDYGNIFPADMDGDGVIDLVGYRNNTILAIYLNDGLGNFTPLDIENTSSFNGWGNWPVWVKDVDLDGRPDILAPMRSGLYVYYQIDSLTFSRQQVVDSGPYWCGTYISFADAGDVDNDGDMDIVATNGCGPGTGGGGGDVILLRNDGGTWTPVMIHDATSDTNKAMRIYLVDFDGDGLLDIQTSFYPVMVFRNLGGSFTLSNYYYSGTAVDGSWPIDVDGDGDVDIVYAPFCFISYLRNDGGFTFTEVNVGSECYDGLYAGDFNSDGYTDFLGAYQPIDIYVGPSYALYNLSSGWDIHNLYFANVDMSGCFNIQQDIVFSNMPWLSSRPVGHYMLRNRTVTSYASVANLTSSVLHLPPGSCSFDSLYYIGCTPSNWQINVYVRWASGDASAIYGRPWIGPVTSGTSLPALGLTPSADNYLQYKVEFVYTGAGSPGEAPMLDSIWVTTNCSILVGEDELEVEESKSPGRSVSSSFEIFTVDGRRVDRMEKRGVYFIYDGKKIRRVVKR